MKTAQIIETVIINDETKMQVTKSADSFNGLIYVDGKLVGACAVGVHQTIKDLTEKAVFKLKTADL